MNTQVIVLLMLAAGTVAAQRENGQSSAAPGFVQRLDQDGDGYISTNEFDGPAEHFTQFDGDGDGYISEEEARAVPPPRRPQGGQQEEQQDQRPPRNENGTEASGAGFVQRLDQDGDGFVSESEFDGPAEVFTHLDTDSDGYLGEEEAPTGPPRSLDRERPGPQGGSQEQQSQERPQQDDFITRLDQDGDGFVSSSEFDGPAEAFTHLDTNGDGYLGEGEAPSGPPPRENR